MTCEESAALEAFALARWIIVGFIGGEEKDWKMSWSGFEEVLLVARLRVLVASGESEEERLVEALR